MKNFRIHLLASFMLALNINIAACNPVIATSAPTATAAPTLQSGDFTRTLKVDDVERSYVLHIPPGLDSSQPVPVLFAFHGADQSPEDMKASTGFNNIADTAGFLVVYPKGMERSWNVGECCGYAAANNIDEISFVRQLLSDLGTSFNMDSKRIYAVGMSNGALLVYQLACEMSDVFAAIAPVSGVMVSSPCQPQEPVSLIHLHGLADDTVPFEGGGRFDTPPIEDVIDQWVKFDGCTGSPQAETLNKIIKHTAYSSCKAGTAVELYAIEFSGHAWQTMSAWSGSEAIWEFFAAHPKP